MFTEPQRSSTRSAETLERIVAATRSLLAETNYGGLSMRAVATRAGITPGAIYRHFPNKQALVSHVVHTTLEDFHVELLNVIGSHPLQVQTRPRQEPPLIASER